MIHSILKIHCNTYRYFKLNYWKNAFLFEKNIIKIIITNSNIPFLVSCLKSESMLKGGVCESYFHIVDFFSYLGAI